VIDSTVYVTHVATAGAVVQALKTRAGGTLPAGTVVGSALVSPDGFVEIMLTAAKQE